MKIQTLAMLLCTLALAPLGAEETKPAAEGAKKPGVPGGPGGPGGKGDGSFFRNMDKDGDKAISQAEAGERWQGLGKLDKDNDGKVTMQELMAGRPGGPNGPGSGPGKPEGGPGAGRGKGAPGEFFKNADKNSDGKLSKDEVPAQAWERLGKLDKNSDGAVTKEEMAAMTGGPGGPGGPGGGKGAPGEFFGKADKNGDGKITKDEIPAEGWERMSKADKNNDGAVTKEELAGAFAGRGGPGAGPGRPGGPGAGGPQAGPGAMFSRYDTDKDGKLSKSEVPAEMWEKLSKADENADGLVSEKELQGVYRRPDDGSGKPAEKRPEPGPASA
jgi:hypothetical protein